MLGVLPTTDKVVALTFDGGGDDGGAAAILATLRCSGVPASFFVTGRFVTAYPTLVADLATVGPVGNHSWDHPCLDRCDDDEQRIHSVLTPQRSVNSIETSTITSTGVLFIRAGAKRH